MYLGDTNVDRCSMGEVPVLVVLSQNNLGVAIRLGLEAPAHR